MKTTIRVPATSANLGPGFDVAGIALTLYNTFTFELQENGVTITGCPKEFCTTDNLIYQSFKKAAKYCGLNFSGIAIHCESKVPFTRGLGSSSTCIVAGVVAAYVLANKDIDKEMILKLSTEIEGHPDNVAPAIYGGMTISVMEEDRVHCVKLPFHHSYQFVALIPDFTLSTKQAREVLPSSYSREDTITNTSHFALLLASLVEGNDAGIKLGLEDKVHQPYRGKLIPGYFEIMDLLKADEKVLGTYLSGAGPTIMVMMKEDHDEATSYLKSLLGRYIASWKILSLKIDQDGYQIL